MKREIQEGKDYTFEWKFYRDNLQIIPTSVTLTFYDSSGTELVTDTSGTASLITIAADGTITYTLDADYTTPDDPNYKVIIKYTYGGIEYEQAELYDVAVMPLTNNSRDEDLFVYLPELRTKIQEYRGQVASTGTTSAFVDNNLKADYRSFKGGRGELYLTATEKVLFEVTNFARSTGTISFTPTQTEAVASGLRFTLRSSYQDIIDEAYNQHVVRDIRNRIGLAAGYIDSNVTKNMTVFKALSIYCFGQVESENDKWDLRSKKFDALYSAELAKLEEPYDQNKDGNIDTSENIDRGFFSTGRMVL